jgi:hypothetical protein
MSTMQMAGFNMYPLLGTVMTSANVIGTFVSCVPQTESNCLNSELWNWRCLKEEYSIRIKYWSNGSECV